jgi:alpha-amylase
MFANVDHGNPEVRTEFQHWATSLGKSMKLGGLRLDAIKHYSRGFLEDFVNRLDQSVGNDWFYVGEYWDQDSYLLAEYIDYFQGRISLFDIKLVNNFSRVSLDEDADLRTVFDDSLCLVRPENSVVRF